MCSSLKFFLKLSEFPETGWASFAKLRPNLCKCRKLHVALEEDCRSGVYRCLLLRFKWFRILGEEFGFRGLFDRRRGKPAEEGAAAVVERVLVLYREKYFDLNVRHFHEKMTAEHQIEPH